MRGARLSRILIVILLGILGIGAVVYICHQSPAEQAAAPAATDAPSAAPASQPTPLLAVTPTPAAPVSAPPAPTHPQLAMGSGQNDPPPAPMVVAVSGNPLAVGKAKIAGDDLLGGRAILNDALRSGSLSSADTLTAKALIAQTNQTILFSDRRIAGDPYTTDFDVPVGAAMARIAAHHDVTAALLCRINNLSDPRKLRSGSTIKLIQGPFHAVVTKSTFTMDIYLGPPGEKGSVYVASYPVGLGMDDSTPTGVWIVQPGKKVHDPIYYSPRGAGVVAADDPKNPLGKYWIGLIGTEGHAIGQQSYGIHGTNDESSIGKQASLGCIRMHNADVAQVFDLLVDGKSTVTVRD